MAYEADIQRLNESIQELDKLLKENEINDEQVKKLGNDLLARHITMVHLQGFKEGRYIVIFTYIDIFV